VELTGKFSFNLKEDNNLAYGSIAMFDSMHIIACYAVGTVKECHLNSTTCTHQHQILIKVVRHVDACSFHLGAIVNNFDSLVL